MRVEPGASFVGLRLRFSCAESDCALVSLSVAFTALWVFSAAIRRDRSRSAFPPGSSLQVAKGNLTTKTKMKENSLLLKRSVSRPKRSPHHSIFITKT